MVIYQKKKPVPAGKFNAGQKTWYWLATLGGMVMILTGATKYFLDFNIAMINSMTGLSQIDLLRVSAILHGVFGLAIIALFLPIFIWRYLRLKVQYKA